MSRQSASTVTTTTSGDSLASTEQTKSCMRQQFLNYWVYVCINYFIESAHKAVLFFLIYIEHVLNLSFLCCIKEAQETLNDLGSSFSSLMQQFTQTNQKQVRVCWCSGVVALQPWVLVMKHCQC